MDAQNLFSQALVYEKKIRDLYLSAMEKVDDDRGKSIFKALAEDEQSHVDFLEYSLDILAANQDIDIGKLTTAIPPALDKGIGEMKEKMPERMLGDIKEVLNAALALEVETSSFYKTALDKSDGPVKEILEKFYEIEQRHVEVVQIQLDHATGNGYWFNFMETDMED